MAQVGMTWKYILRHVLILTMALKRRLPTKDKLFRFGITQFTMCVLCNENNEDLNNFFSSAHFAISFRKGS